MPGHFIELGSVGRSGNGREVAVSGRLEEHNPRTRHDHNRWVELSPDPSAAIAQLRILRASIAPHDWRIREHKLAGAPTLVGTAFLDIALSLAQDLCKTSQVALDRVYFLQPLAMFGARPVVLTCEVLEKNGGLELVFLSEDQDHAAKRREHVRCEARPFHVSSSASYDFEALRERMEDCGPSAWLGERDSRQVPLECSERWECLANVHRSQDEWFARVALREQYAGDNEFGYQLHPALLDAATSFALKFMGESLFLPLQYRRLEFYRPLPFEFYSYVRRRPIDAADTSAEIRRLDVTLLTLSGEVIVEIRDYVLKRGPEAFRLDSSGKLGVLTEGVGDKMLVAEALSAFERCLLPNLPSQIVIATRPLKDLQDEAKPVALGDKEQSQADAGMSLTSHPRPELATDYIKPNNPIEEEIAQIWELALGITGIGTSDNFMELGGNSLLAIQVISRTNSIFQIDLSFESFYLRPTITGMAEAITTQLALMLEPETLSELLSELENEPSPWVPVVEGKAHGANTSGMK